MNRSDPPFATTVAATHEDTPQARQAPRRREVSAPRTLDLTGRERQLRSGMQAMALVAQRFARAARRTLPFLVRRKARLLPRSVAIVDTMLPPNGHGPEFVVQLEAEETSAWGALILNAGALQIMLDGALGGALAGKATLGAELTLAQRALISRVARSLAEDFASAVREEAGLTLRILSAHARSAGDAQEQGRDGLRVDCMLEGLDPAATISLAVSADALEVAVREHEEEQPQTADPRMAEALGEVPVELVAQLGSLTMGLRHVLSLQVGQVLRLPTAIDDPVRVRVAGLVKFTGRPVVSRGQMAIEIKGRE